MTSLHDLIYDSSISDHYPALSQAAALVGTTQLQSMGTIGGNLCLNTRCIYYNQSESWRRSRDVCFKMGGHVCHVVPKGKKCYAVFSGDTVPALIALDAEVKLVNNTEERIVSVSKLYTGDGKDLADISVYQNWKMSNDHTVNVGQKDIKERFNSMDISFVLDLGADIFLVENMLYVSAAGRFYYGFTDINATDYQVKNYDGNYDPSHNAGGGFYLGIHYIIGGKAGE